LWHIRQILNNDLGKHQVVRELYRLIGSGLHGVWVEPVAERETQRNTAATPATRHDTHEQRQHTHTQRREGSDKEAKPTTIILP
jgi:hypothetical protein